jgi:uncharacterized protein DUF2278
MPLDKGYGVAIGTFVSFTREDPNDFGHWYHGKLTIATPAGPYEAALDVDTPTGVGVSYRVVTGLTVADLPVLGALTDGFHRLDPNATSGALDYIRSPLLADPSVVQQLRWHGPAWLSFAAPAAQPWSPTPLERIIEVFGDWLPERAFPWIASDGDNALDRLETLLVGAVRIYVFGEPFSTDLGVHNVHLNQGDPLAGGHQGEDGVWQDGCVLVQLADGDVTAWQVKFNSQSLHTDDATGLPV